MDNTFYIVFAVAVIIVVAVLLSFIVSSRNWSETTAEVLSSEIESITGSDTGGSAINYKVNIEYEYQVEGETYIGTKIMVMLPNIYERKSDAEEVIAAYPKGGSVVAYYNPKRPSQSALVAGKQIPIVGILFFVLFASAIVGGIIWVLKSDLLAM